MTDHSNEPPPVLLCARVVEYAVLTSSVRYSGHSFLFFGDKEVGPVPRLAICQKLDETTFTLFHCDDEWEVLGIAANDASIAEAKARAERIYPGVSECWVDPQVTEADAASYIEQEFADDRCRFCGRLPPDFEKLVVHERGGSICNSCIDELYAFIHEDPESSSRPPEGSG